MKEIGHNLDGPPKGKKKEEIRNVLDLEPKVAQIGPNSYCDASLGCLSEPGKVVEHCLHWEITQQVYSASFLMFAFGHKFICREFWWWGYRNSSKVTFMSRIQNIL